jgi:hypothetical protein
VVLIARGQDERALEVRRRLRVAALVRMQVSPAQRELGALDAHALRFHQQGLRALYLALQEEQAACSGGDGVGGGDAAGVAAQLRRAQARIRGLAVLAELLGQAGQEMGAQGRGCGMAGQARPFRRLRQSGGEDETFLDRSPRHHHHVQELHLDVGARLSGQRLRDLQAAARHSDRFRVGEQAQAALARAHRRLRRGLELPAQ